MATLGDPASDVALMAAYRHPALDDVLGVDAAWTDDRFPGPDDFRHAYEAVARREVIGWNVHLALAFYKLAAIAEGIVYRYGHGAANGDGQDAERVARAVPQFLEAGLARLAAHD